MHYMSAVILAAFFCLPAGQAAAQCLPREDAVKRLEIDHLERQAGIGVTQQGRHVVELFVSETGSWTILMTHPNGYSCGAQSGTGWQILSPSTDEGT